MPTAAAKPTERRMRALLDQHCPRLCDGDVSGVGTVLRTVVRESGLSLERVSYAWRTTHTLADFCARLVR